jgi:hypothetical protein
MQIMDERQARGQRGEKGPDGKERGGPHGEPIRGPQAGRFDPNSDGSKRKFKGGEKNGANDKLCKKRYQQVAITALGNLTSSSRILQSVPTTPVYTMQLTVGTEDFDSSSALSKFAYSFAALALALLTITLA